MAAPFLSARSTAIGSAHEHCSALVVARRTMLSVGDTVGVIERFASSRTESESPASRVLAGGGGGAKAPASQ